MSFPSGYDLRALRAFTLVAELGSMTLAAKQLGITQSSMSEAIADLETAVGTKLFDRGVRPIILTAAGRSLHQSAHALLNMATDVLCEARDADQLGLSSLTVAMVESFAHAAGAPLYRELGPVAKRWRIWSGISADMHAALLNRSADMIVTASDDLDATEGLERHLLLTERFVIAAPPAWADAARDLDKLSELPFIRYSTRSAIGRQIEQQINRLRLQLPFHAEFDWRAGPISSVVAGLGWCMLTPLCLVPEQETFDRICLAPMSRGGFQRRVTLIARAGELTEVASRLAVTAREILRKKVFPQLLAQHGWLENYIEIGS